VSVTNASGSRLSPTFYILVQGQRAWSVYVILLFRLILRNYNLKLLFYLAVNRNKKGGMRMIKKQIISAVITTSLLQVATTADAVLINFDTRQDGTPYTGLSDSFLANEYDGVIINDSDAVAGSVFVNQVDPVNVGTAISGYHVMAGSNPNGATLLELSFTNPVDSVSFDYALPRNTFPIFVGIFDASGLIFSDPFGIINGGYPFISQTGTTFYGVHLEFSYLDFPGLTKFTKLNLWSPSTAMMLDNLSITAVPVPATIWLFGSGLIGLIGFARRK
jgi:hypothetical protein